MANSIFNDILDQKVKTFKDDFVNRSQSRFKTNGSCFHSGEYGTYREKICTVFLKSFIPSRLDIGQGFIITSKDNHSTECDLIVYDNNLTPPIRSDELNKFYTVESIAGIVEVKSKLSKANLKEAINKLAKNKMLRLDVERKDSEFRISKLAGKSFNPKELPNDNIFTAIICESFSFDINDLVSEISDMYEEEIPDYARHNMILSVKDGLLMYNLSNVPLYAKYEEVLYQYPVLKLNNNIKALNSTCVIPGNNETSHIKEFLHSFLTAIMTTTILSPEILGYVSGFKKIKE